MAKKPNTEGPTHKTLIDGMASMLAHRCGMEFDGLMTASKNHWRSLILWSFEGLKNNIENVKNAEARETILRLIAYLEKEDERVGKEE